MAAHDSTSSDSSTALLDSPTQAFGWQGHWVKVMLGMIREMPRKIWVCVSSRMMKHCELYE